VHRTRSDRPRRADPFVAAANAPRSRRYHSAANHAFPIAQNIAASFNPASRLE